ncbi:MAG TPA: glycosyl transferase family 2 [Cyanobacteria bacterium UBA11372]|nr:glycosyl transferase family 2 [Cyanobacteria bacterium UBA11372]
MLEETTQKFITESTIEQVAQSFKLGELKQEQKYRPLVSLIVPAYNEAAIVEKNLAILCDYMTSLEGEYRWEMLVINDGSKDDTAEKAEAFARNRENVRVLHHIVNFGLGQALKTALSHSRGDYVIPMDIDLSYSVDHIERLLTKIKETGAKIVIASPYMQGGKVSNVPWLRKVLSVWANRFLSATSHGDLTTLTGLVRVYDGKFVRSLNLRAMSMDINPEVIYKARILRARIEEIPAHLCWTDQKVVKVAKKKKKAQRRSSMRILRQIWAVGFIGFIFRPVMFFFIPGLLLFLLSMYANIWVLIHCFSQYERLAQYTKFPDLTDAVAAAFYQAPHTFVIGGITLILAIQLMSLGILAMQSKSYFEEIFYLGSSIYRANKEK